jgi:hypothetical protein
MENKDIEATHNRPDGERIIDTSQLLIDVPSFIKQIKGESSGKKAIAIRLLFSSQINCASS